jgi:hypothetical protein
MKLLNEIQQKLKAPKGQRNTFGNYNYRSCEDILEAVKPLLGEAVLTITDEIVLIGNRYYIKATVTLKDKDGTISNVSAFARESEIKKGMDESQITGAASSYARKYALNGLFCIDDTKDADTKDNTETATPPAKTAKPPVKTLSPAKPSVPTKEEGIEIEKIQILLEEAVGENVIDPTKLIGLMREVGKGRYPKAGKANDVAKWIITTNKVGLLVKDGFDGEPK